MHFNRNFWVAHKPQSKCTLAGRINICLVGSCHWQAQTSAKLYALAFSLSSTTSATDAPIVSCTGGSFLAACANGQHCSLKRLVALDALQIATAAINLGSYPSK